MSNKYAFDFLRTEHTLGGIDSPHPVRSALPTPSIQTVSAESVAHKPDLEKQADILRFLKAHRSAGYLPPSIIYRGTGIDLDEADEAVLSCSRKIQKLVSSKFQIQRIHRLCFQPMPINPNSIMFETEQHCGHKLIDPNTVSINET